MALGLGIPAWRVVQGQTCDAGPSPSSQLSLAIRPIITESLQHIHDDKLLANPKGKKSNELQLAGHNVQTGRCRPIKNKQDFGTPSLTEKRTVNTYIAAAFDVGSGISAAGPE